jgi:4'-phosphopantetheinyl transferase EntD
LITDKDHLRVNKVEATCPAWKKLPLTDSDLFKFECVLRSWFGQEFGVAMMKTGNGLKAEYESEACAIRKAVPRRRSEFLTGRRCAREAMKQIGFLAGPIGVGSLKEPLWPAGVVGSITHDDNVCFAVVGSATGCPGIGIDFVANYLDFPLSASSLVFSEKERGILDLFKVGSEVALSASVAFSAKESTIKALSPKVRRLIDFREIKIDLDWKKRRFAAEFVLTQPYCDRRTTARGHFFIQNHGVLTAILRSWGI